MYCIIPTNYYQMYYSQKILERYNVHYNRNIITYICLYTYVLYIVFRKLYIKRIMYW